MTGRLILTPTFTRSYKRLVKSSPGLAAAVRKTLDRLDADAFDPRLRSHKLQGHLGGLWACSVQYDLRVVFEFVEHEARECLMLHDLGTHDQVYRRQ